MAFSILALDLHNTIYDETLEYGQALDEAVSVWLAGSPSLTRETLYAELGAAHQTLGSDWDDDAWALLPSLQALALSREAFDRSVSKAMERRREKSRELTLGGLYEGTHKTLSTLKARGVRIFVVTEASADAAMRAVEWLGLSGVADGVYSYPSRKTPPALKGTYHKPFAAAPEGHLRKPHPLLLAAVALDETIRSGGVPAGTRMENVFKVTQDRTLLIPELPQDAPVQRDITARLHVLDTPHAAALSRTLDHMLYVGDSKFRDGMLARNAGVAFGYAAYGKKGQESDAVRKSLDIMYATTGWDKEVMKLTQEAGRSQAVAGLRPDFTFEHGLAEALGLFIP